MFPGLCEDGKWSSISANNFEYMLKTKQADSKKDGPEKNMIKDEREMTERQKK